MKKIVVLSLLAVAILAIVTLPTEEADASDTFMVYDILNEKEKKVYDEVYATVTSYGTYIDCTSLTPEEETRVYFGMYSDHPELFWFQYRYDYYIYGTTGNKIVLNDGGSALLDTGTSLEPEKYASMIKEIDELVSTLNFTGSDYDKIKQIHDYMCENTWYQYRGNNQNMYGNLIGKSSVCAGYSQAFNYLCKKNGIDCITLRYQDDHNNLDSHLWNAVRLEGKWYQMDVEEDDLPCPGVYNYDYFLVGVEDIINGKPFRSNPHDYTTDYGLNFEKHGYSIRPAGDDWYSYMYGGNFFKNYFSPGQEVVYDVSYWGFEMILSGDTYDIIDSLIKDRTSRVPDFFSFKIVPVESPDYGSTSVKTYQIRFYLNDTELEDVMNSCVKIASLRDQNIYGPEMNLLGKGTVQFDGSGEYTFGELEFSIETTVEGSGSVDVQSKAAVGEKVELSRVSSNSAFVRWESSDVLIEDNYFIMPAKDVKITAVFQNVNPTDGGSDNTLMYVGIAIAGLAIVVIAAVLIHRRV